MKYPYKLSEDVKPGVEAFKNQPQPPEGASFEEVMRGALKEMAKQVAVSSTDEVNVENTYFKNSEGIDIQLRVFSPKKLGNNLPCIYWMHGGGTISGLPEQEDSALYDLSLAVGCVVISVDYRLAPEHPYPAPINDCYQGLVHVFEKANEFNIDNSKIAVGGGSAGGLLSTSCAILAREHNGPKLVHQSLTYPMLDHRATSESNQQITDVGVWDSGINKYAFDCYLKNVKNDIPTLAVPNLVDDLSNLPPAFIAVGTMDCLRDESIEYAQKLAAAGVKAELHIYPGMPHVFDSLAPKSEAVKDFNAVRIAAFKRAFRNA